MKIQRLLASLSARRYLAFSVLAVIVFSTLLVNLATTKSYTATTEIVVDHDGVDPTTGTTIPAYRVSGYMATQAQIVSSHRIALQVVDALGLARDATVIDKFDRAFMRRGDLRSWLADALLRNLEVEPSRDSGLVRIRYSGADPAFAAMVADAFAEAYLHLAIDLNGLKAELDAAQEKLASFKREKELAAAARKSALAMASQADLAQGESSVSAGLAQQESANEQETLVALQHDVDYARRVLDLTTQYFGQASLEGQSGHSQVAVLKHAVPPAMPSRPRMWINLSLALLLGMVSAIGAVLIAEKNDTRVRRPEDCALELNLPILGVLAKVKRKRKSGLSHFLPLQRSEPVGNADAQSGWAAQRLVNPALQRQFSTTPLFTETKLLHPEVIAAIRPNDQKVESLRTLRSQLIAQWFGEHRSMVITAPTGGAGVSHVAANLAVVFAQYGGRILLIDANLRHPRQDTLFRLPNHAGLSDILAGRAGLEAAQRINGLHGIFVLTAGTPTADPHELFAGPALKALLNQAEENYDIVIFDSPPARMHAEAQLLSASVGGALIVARPHHTRIADVKELQQRLDDAGAQAVGVLFNNF